MAILSVIYVLHCLGLLCKLPVYALRNKTYFRKYEVTKRELNPKL